ncbi:MAG: DUF47 family protein [Gemmataceae bacterium]|nr:DUF47 family protein [Gemmataceae bacterium]
MVFLMPREEKFFDLFDEAAELLVRASRKFLEMVSAFDNLAVRAEELKDEEHACDLVVEQIIKALDRSFVTPMDREDIHRLATSLDNVLDNMEEVSHRFLTFRIDRPTPEQVEMAQIIHDCCGHIARAVQLCRRMKELDQMEISLREVGRLENEADRIYRDTEAKLFSHPPEILTLIKMRELYGWMEETVDACRAVAQVISEIVIKGS